MYEFTDAVEFYIRMVNALKSGDINPHSPLEAISLKAGKNNFAYIDNRRDAKGKYNYDLWDATKNRFEDEKQFVSWIKSKVNKKLLYSK